MISKPRINARAPRNSMSSTIFSSSSSYFCSAFCKFPGAPSSPARKIFALESSFATTSSAAPPGSSEGKYFRNVVILGPPGVGKGLNGQKSVGKKKKKALRQPTPPPANTQIFLPKRNLCVKDKQNNWNPAHRSRLDCCFLLFPRMRQMQNIADETIHMHFLFLKNRRRRSKRDQAKHGGGKEDEGVH